MLFLGTKKYPEENAYLSFLNAHGGTYNGYTASESTNYMFEVAAEYLEPTLDLFAQFFIEPLFTESGTNREVEAVQSEHAKNLQSDNWRMQRLNEVLASKKHPLSKFGTGTSKTLQAHVDLRDQVIEFWKTHYSANIMKLVVLGKDSLEDLERMVRDKFSAIENKQIGPPNWSGKPYEPETLATRLSAIPVAEIQRLTLAWPTQGLREHFRTKPEGYLSHLVGHEGQGSILSYLKGRGWAENLMAGGRTQADHTLFQVTIDLSPEGVKHVNDIISVVYAYIALIKDHGISKELYHELTVLGDLAFRFKDKEDPFAFVSSVASSMQLYPAEYALYGGRVSDRYEPELIKSVLEQLEPQNMLVGVFSPSFKKGISDTSEFEPNQVEEHYGIEYRLDKLDSKLLEGWKAILSKSPSEINSLFSGLETPKINPFMPDDLTLVAPPTDKDPHAAPEIILDTPTLRVWHKQDQTFQRPRAFLMLDFHSPVAYYSPKTVVMTKMFIDYLSDELNEFGYDALIAGLKSSVSATLEGCTIHVSGYNCKQYILLETLLKRFKSLEINPERFELLRVMALRVYQNTDFGAAYTLSNYQLALHMEQPRWYYHQYMAEMARLTPKDVQDWIPQLLSSLYVEMVAIGNIDATQAKKVAELLTTTLEPKPFLPGQFIQFRYVALDTEREHWVQYRAPNPEETNSAIINYFQIGSTSPKISATLELLNQIVSPLAFDTLRTKEQLGYIVATAPRLMHGIEGWMVIIQSAKANPTELNARIEAWINSVPEHLEKLSDDDFEQNRIALILQKREKHTSLRKEAAYYWESIVSPHSYDFEIRENEAVVLESASKADVIQFWNTYFSTSAPKRAKMSVQTWPSAHSPSLPTDSPAIPINLVKDPFLFKGRMPLHGIAPLGKERVTVADRVTLSALAARQASENSQ